MSDDCGACAYVRMVEGDDEEHCLLHGGTWLPVTDDDESDEGTD